jgi:hypothetical protein
MNLQIAGYFDIGFSVGIDDHFITEKPIRIRFSERGFRFYGGIFFSRE